MAAPTEVEFYEEPEVQLNQLVVEVIRVETEGSGFPEYIRRKNAVDSA